jgi:hypothetical protein
MHSCALMFEYGNIIYKKTGRDCKPDGGCFGFKIL